MDSPKHSTLGSPQKSSWHSRQVRPPKPGMQWHCPVNCQSQKANPSVSPWQLSPAPSRGQASGTGPSLGHRAEHRAQGPSLGHRPRRLTSLQAGPRERAGSQSQCSQPVPLARRHVWGAQRSHVCPTTLGRHRHCPVAAAQRQLSESSQSSRTVPR